MKIWKCGYLSQLLYSELFYLMRSQRSTYSISFSHIDLEVEWLVEDCCFSYNGTVHKCSHYTQWKLTVPSPESSVTDAFSELNQYSSGIASGQYHISTPIPYQNSINSMLLENWYRCSVSDLIAKKFRYVPDTDLDQLNSSSDSKFWRVKL